MRRRTRVALGLFGAVAALGVLGLAALLVFTQSDWGRDRVRRLALEQLGGSVNGRVEVGRVRGNLLSGVTLDEVVITDSAGAPFFRADTVSLRYSLRSLFSRRVYLSDVRLARPVVVLDQRPGEDWNFARIFPSDTTPADTTARGFGSWVRIDDLRVRDGRLLVRAEWLPDDSLRGAARDSAVATALSEENRLRVVRVAGGFQSIQDFQSLHAHFPLLRLADPDSANLRVDIARLSTVAYPFRPPAAQIRDLSGRFVMGEDSLWFTGVRATLPGTRLAAEGAYHRDSGDLRTQLHGAPLALGDLRWILPTLPETGGGSVRLAVARRGERTRVLAREIDLRMEGARLAGHADVTVGDSLRLGPTDLRFAGVDTRLARRFAPDLEVPVDGTLNGRLALAGAADALLLDGRLVFTERTGGTSRVFAAGEIGTEDGFRARNLRLRFDPVQVALARGVRPDLPIGGTLSGRATLNGSARTRFDLDADLVHRDPRAGRSRLLARGAVELGETPRARDLRLRFDPVQVALVKAWAPELPVGGTVTGHATLNGNAERLELDADLVHRDPRAGRSRLLATGRVESAGDGFAARDLRLRFDPLQVALARAFAPDLPVGGTVSGRATLNGSADTRIAADLDLVHRDVTGRTRLVGDARVTFGEPQRFDVDLSAPTLALATVGRFAPAAGLRGSGSGALRARGTLGDLDLALDLAPRGGGRVNARGTFDLASSEPRYDFGVRFTGFDAGAVSTRAPETALTGTVAAQGRGTDPATLRATLRADLVDARVDSLGVDAARVVIRVANGLARVERATVRLASASAEVDGSFGLVGERSGTLRYRVAVDSLADFARYLPADTTPVAGSLLAAGVVSGSVKRFDLRGNLQLSDLVVANNSLRAGRAEYTLLGGGTPGASLALDAGLDSLRAGGLALDSVIARVRHREGPRGGTADLMVFQDADRDARLRADYRLGADRSEVRLDDVLLRLGEVRWTSAQPGTVRWGGDAVEVRSLELRDGAGGRVFADGRLPSAGTATGDLQLAVERLQIGGFAALLQDTMQTAGLLSLQARITGTQAAPRIRGDAALVDAEYGGTALPALHTDFSYADAELQARAELRGETPAPLLTAEARVPVNLALSGVEGERLLNRPFSVDVRADSLPLESLPSFTEAVSDVRGRLRGTVSVRGTPQAPEIDGAIDLDLASLALVQPGVRLRDLAGGVRIRNDSVLVDSLVALSDGGPIRLSGVLDISTPAEPGFALVLAARDARVLDNEMGRLRADADLAIDGPFDAVRVTGDVHLREGVIRPPATDPRVIDLDDPRISALIASSGIAPEGLGEGNALVDNLRVEVGVRIARNTWVRTPEANVEIHTPEETGALALRMARGEQTLALEGTVVTDRGEYEFSGRRFELSHGSVTFLGTPEINPLLQITAEHEVPQRGREALAIQINVAGTLQEPRITLESNAQPPLSQSDLLSYLAFGRSSSALLQQGGSGLDQEGGGGSGNVGALATQKLTAVALGALVNDAVTDLERGGAREFGLDVFRISPTDLPSELRLDGASNLLRGTELEAGRYLTSRWFVAGQGRATALPGVRVEYRTPAGFRWMTTWEPRYQPAEPSFSTADEVVAQRRVLGTFLFWEWRY